MKFPIKAALLTVVIFAASSLALAQTEPDYVLSYRAGNSKAAEKQAKAATKQNSQDGKAWYYLGLARVGQDDHHDARRSLKNALKSLPNDSNVLAALAWTSFQIGATSDAMEFAEKSLSSDSQNAHAHYVKALLLLPKQDYDSVYDSASAAIESNPQLWAAYRLRAFALIGKFDQERRNSASGKGPSSLLFDAASDFEVYIRNVTTAAHDPFGADYLESIRFYADYYKKTADVDGTAVPTAKDRTSFRIRSKPGAPFSADARTARIEGSVRVAVQLREDGRVGHILLLTPLGFGLDENVMKTASLIDFEPARNRGLPVSTLATLEYSFKIS